MLKNTTISGFVFLSVYTLLTACSPRGDLDWTEEEGYRWAELNPGFFGSTGFEQLKPGRTNIHFSNDLRQEEMVENRHFLN